MRRHLLITIVIVGIIGISTAGCGENVASPGTATNLDEDNGSTLSAEYQPDLSQGVQNTTITESSSSEGDTNIIENVSEHNVAAVESTDSTETEDASDPLYLLRVNNEDINDIINASSDPKIKDSSYMNAAIFLVRDGNTYALDLMPIEKAVENNVGFCKYYQNKLANLYFTSWYDIVSMGDIPVPVLQEGDEIHLYSSSIKDIRVFPAEFEGYTLEIYYDNCLVEDCYTLTQFENNAVIIDSNGDEVCSFNDDARYNLSYGERYKIAWTEGTTKRTLDAVADSKKFKFDSNYTVVEGQVTDYGYAILDFSNLEPGYYNVCGGLLEIR